MNRFLMMLCLLTLSVFCFAHDPKLSGIGIVMKGRAATIAVQVPAKNLVEGDQGAQISKRLALFINGESFVPARAELTVDRANGIAYWRAPYEGVIRSLSVSQRLFPEDSESRTIVSPSRDGQELQETILDRAHPSMDFGKPQQIGVVNVVGQFVSLGVMHIFSGLDHILFILGLILLGGGLKPLLKTVTAFTAAHSITLTVAALGWWAPPSRYVEPLIALSIVAVAFENLRKRNDTPDWRPLIAFGFGLIHGFGFAGGLTEAGLPHGAIGWALASFNIGVECAQASIVVIAAPFLAALAKTKPKLSYGVVVAGSVVIAIAGAFWFVDRVRIG